MTLPRQVLPGQTYLLTRRCLERRFLLRPDPEVTQTFLYCLGLAAERHGVEVSSVTALANHHHTTALDPRGELPAFARDLHGNVARALNVFRRRGESFWAPGSYSAVRLEDKEAVLARMVYTITNVVEAGLVERPEQWPGVCTQPEDVGVRVIEVARPRFFFRSREEEDDEEDASEETARDRARRHAPPREPLPEVVRLPIVKPREFADMPDDEFRRLLRERVDARVAEIHARRRAAGKTRFLGAEAVLAQDPNDAPAGGTFPDGGLNPRLACADKWKRLERQGALVAFWREHQIARDRFRAGERAVLFPAGTWGAVRVMGARASPAFAA